MTIKGGSTKRKRTCMSIVEEIIALLGTFKAISLDEVAKASLMRRKDSKYILSVTDLPQILPEIRPEYRVLEIEDQRSHGYVTHYFDTPDLEMYQMHHRGKANRHKVRFRKYGTSDLHFLEVKTKNAKGFTIKNRVKTNGMGASILTTEEEFLLSHTPYQASNMVPVLGNQFNRITLVRLDQSERITLDYGLHFMRLDTDQSIDLPGVSIAEIKYRGLLAGSPFSNALRGIHVTPDRFSKYAIGTSLLRPELKQNRFKMKIRKVHRINEQYLNNLKSELHA